MATLEQASARLYRGTAGWRRFARSLEASLPKGLYTRSILIVVLPMIFLQSVVAYVFMERHWQLVTQRMSSAVSRDVTALVEMIERFPQDAQHATISEIAAETLGIRVSVLPPNELPSPIRRPFFSLLDQALSRELRQNIDRPFWIDTAGTPSRIEIRVQLDEHILRFLAPRNQAYASNSHIFLIWMVGTSLVLIAIALVFLRNQIRPILRLADAAEEFGKGGPVGAFRPQGAREVRRASQAFIEMRERIERQIEQRTAMLSGVSHDLRTILTRFKLQLELLDDSPERDALNGDVDEMSQMLEAYLEFARGHSGERTRDVHLPRLLEELADGLRRQGCELRLSYSGEPNVRVRPVALRRCVANLLGNARKYAGRVELNASHHDGWIVISIEDDGPGIPEEERETVFRPFYRLDKARNVDAAGTGLGLTIARDVARSHGGDIELSESRLGGLKAVLRIPG